MVILASASPRRKELLGGMGIDFAVKVSKVDESIVSKEVPPPLYVQELAFIKAAAVAKVCDDSDAVVISADTIVVNDDEILGKPNDEEDAKRMLGALSGKTHQVYTGYCVMRVRDMYTVCKSVCTNVTFKELGADKIAKYTATGEPMDKAGAYGIQGYGAMLIERIEGDYFNVVGLPVSSLADTLEEDFGFELFDGDCGR